MNVDRLRDERVLSVDVADVGEAREHSRRRRLSRLLMVIGVIGVWLWGSVFVGHLVGTPHLTHSERQALPLVGVLLLVAAVMVLPLLAAGRSPHVRYRPGGDRRLSGGCERDTGGGRGGGPHPQPVPGSRHLPRRDGRDPRKGILFEGPPGTGKTHLAKALAREAGVPFFFVSSSAFQSMFYGQTNRKIRSFFTELRKAARQEGGAIGFIEEIDAIGASRAGMGAGGGREGIAGVVNELLIQLQSFDQPPWRARWWGGVDRDGQPAACRLTDRCTSHRWHPPTSW